MNLDQVEKIAEAVLYEGYMLYPYRASAVKNQQRWNFGVLCPRAYSEAQNGSDAWMMQTECLLQTIASTRLGVKIRFLQIVDRSIGKLTRPVRELTHEWEPEFEIVDKLDARGQTHSSWQEAAEREVIVSPLHPADFLSRKPVLFEFSASRELEPIRDASGLIVGVFLREWKEIAGSVEIGVKDCGEGLIKVTVRIRNLTLSESPHWWSRADALRYSLVSVHTILVAEGGQFVSLLDPAQELQMLVGECCNVGTWPVLVGDAADRSTVLSSPIILYDYPQIAPESPGSLFDGTEIDEILSLRILTMTDEEKHEMRQSDERARHILERTENMPPEQFMKLHGALRGLQPVGTHGNPEAR
jgi:hydrogenase maturation protease